MNSSMLEIFDVLIKHGYSIFEAELLLGRFLEEEAYDYIEYMSQNIENIKRVD